MKYPRHNVLAFGVALLGLLVACRDSQRLWAAAPETTASQAFKNIQVLKNSPADELIPTMQFISASLGVECDFCHVEREMDRDDKKTKRTAREMMRMMLAINQNNFAGQREVTCNTCHRGSIHPESIPVISRDGSNPVTAQPEHDDEADRATWPSGSAVLGRYLEAVGGKAALERVMTRVETGNIILGAGHELPIEIYVKSPDLRVSVMHTPTGDSVTGYNGHEGWVMAPGRPLQAMSAADQYAARLDATLMFPAHLTEMFAALKLQPHSEQVGEKAASVVWGISEGRPPVKLYFDPQTGLLMRMLHYSETALGLNPTQIDYADYRETSGIKTPYRWTIARPSGAFTVQLNAVRNNTPIDAAKFDEPARTPEDTPQKTWVH